MFKLFKSLIRNHFGFSRAETNGMLLLLPLILLTVFSPFLFSVFFNLFTEESILDAKSALEWKKELEKNVIVRVSEKRSDAPEAKVTATARYKKSKAGMEKRRFEFNPNSVSSEELRSLGFKKWTANNWLKFRTKGGRFYQIEDLQKIYGMDTVLLKSLQPLIRFDPAPIKDHQKRKTDSTIQTYVKPVIHQTDLNLTSQEDLQKVSGIGEKLSERIIRYRDNLGGFHSFNQLYDVYHLDSTVVKKVIEKFKIVSSVKGIIINEISAEELSHHPLFSKKLARIIVNYRDQHGTFEDLSAMSKIHILSDSTLSKMKPYLRFDKRSDIFNDE